MGASQSVIDRAGQYRLYDYPYGYQKVTQFPFKFFFQQSLFFRCLVAGFVVVLPITVKIQSAVTTKENKELWQETRRARKHTFFEPPKPVEYPSQPPHWW